ncbi:MAG TPA: hypothetical protein VEO01_02655 [Pseudonocardiaceae bacterium]|nr:hypothetical protein [Pseudonocardiaceae bacterium]
MVNVSAPVAVRIAPSMPPTTSATPLVRMLIATLATISDPPAAVATGPMHPSIAFARLDTAATLVVSPIDATVTARP